MSARVSARAGVTGRSVTARRDRRTRQALQACWQPRSRSSWKPESIPQMSPSRFSPRSARTSSTYSHTLKCVANSRNVWQPFVPRWTRRLHDDRIVSAAREKKARGPRSPACLFVNQAGGALISMRVPIDLTANTVLLLIEGLLLCKRNVAAVKPGVEPLLRADVAIFAVQELRLVGRNAAVEIRAVDARILVRETIVYLGAAGMIISPCSGLRAGNTDQSDAPANSGDFQNAIDAHDFSLSSTHGPTRHPLQ